MSQFLYYFSHLFSTEGLPPRWLCGVWTPFQGWFYILSDLGIWAAYFTIPILLLSFIRKKKDVPFLRIFWLFAAFIFACGMTHFFDALMFWWPAYRLSGLVYFYTAVVSWVTVFALIPTIPKALALKSPARLESEIQERIKAEQALRQSEAKFRLLVDSVADYAIFSLTPEGNVASWNKGAERVNGYKADEIIGKHFSVFYPQEVAETGFPQYELKVAGEEGRFEDEGWRIRKDGSRVWANVVIGAIRDEQGTLLGFSKVTRDLTERKLAEEKLQTLNAELEEQVEQRTESLRRSLKREQLITMIVNSIRAESDLDIILMKTITLLGQYAHADRCIFWLCDDSGYYQVPLSEYHSVEHPALRYIRDLSYASQPFLAASFDHSEIINISNVSELDALSEEDATMMRERSVKSLLSVPVLFNEQFLGRLQIHAVFEPREWDDDLVNVVQQVSGQVAMAIHQASLMRSLIESEARKSAIMDSAMDAVIMMDHNGAITEWNTSAERIFGYSRAQVLGQLMEQFIIPERLRTPHQQGLARYLETGVGPRLNQLIEVPGLRADGTEFELELTVTQVPMEGPALFTGMLRDITERKQAERALIESEERFRLMANASPVPIWMMGPSQEMIYMNLTMQEFFGLDRYEEVLGKGWQAGWIYAEDLPAVKDAVAQATLEKCAFSLECRLQRADGQYRWVLLSGSPRLDGQEHLQGFIGTALDIHERKLNTEALEIRVQERTAQLQVANKELEAFSYSVSHDLRAPLRTIDGFSQAILEMYRDKLDARGQDYLNRIRTGSQQMAKLIDDMLQLSRLTRGELNMEEGINLSEMAELIMETLRSQEPDRRVRAHIERDLIVRGDRRLLEAVLQNLLDNAWKYTSRHEVACIDFGRFSTSGTTIFYVQDDGAGFEMQYADKLFGAFQRLHGVEEFPGTGVGLATVARIIHRHGGEVWADAEVEKGATFFFTLQPVNQKEMDYAMSNRQSHSPCRG